MKGQVCFIWLSFRMVFFVLLFRKHLLHFLCSLLCYLFIKENFQTNIKGKRLRSSCSQMFFKIVVLQNFAILLRRHLHWSLFLIKLKAWSNWHTTLNRRRFHVDITSICGRPNFDELSRRFHALFWMQFFCSKNPRCFYLRFRCNFDGGEIHVVCMYFSRRNFDGQIFDLTFD